MQVRSNESEVSYSFRGAVFMTKIFLALSSMATVEQTYIRWDHPHEQILSGLFMGLE